MPQPFTLAEQGSHPTGAQINRDWAAQAHCWGVYSHGEAILEHHRVGGDGRG